MYRGVASALLAGVVAFPVMAAASPPRQPNAGELALAVAHLQVVGNVLYIAAHPDDENTRLLAWLVGERGVRARYLSLTRGDGGQNLLGREQGDLFGLIRTAELLEARRIDGAEQVFTRAVDFGYSKSTDESLRLWRYPEVLVDVVRAIRTFKPDVVIARFSAADAKTHGHHSASARLATEAYEAAADPNAFRAELPGLEPWRAQRLLWNKSTWSKPPEEDWSKDLPTDVGTYSPLLGESWGEIAGRSRSMHKSQGFGAEQQRGPIPEYFEVLKGERPESDILAGIDMTWKRAGGDDALVSLLQQASQSFDGAAPHKILPQLLEARAKIRTLPESHDKASKLAELDGVIAACAGLWLEATAEGFLRAPGEDVEVTATAINRSPFPVELLSMRVGGPASAAPTAPADAAGSLADNQPRVVKTRVAIAKDAEPTTPYWLREPADGALYRVPSPDLIGLPTSPAPLEVTFEVKLGGETLTFTREVEFKWVDPVVGERRRPFEIHPAVTVTLDHSVLVFAGASSRRVRVVAKAGAATAEGRLRLAAPEGWRVDPAEVSFTLAAREAEAAFDFTITPPPASASTAGILRAVADVGGRELSQALVRIQYPHIPIQTLFPRAEAKLVTIDLARDGNRIGYVPGAGDDVAGALADVGYDVTMLDDDALWGDLSHFDAIVLGVRAYNTRAHLQHHHDHLMKWVEAGGTLVTQYNAVNRIADITGPLGPYPFEITRERVTDEASPVRFDVPGHSVLHTPNEITAADFEGWVQERGLYFADKEDARFRAPIAFQDAGEDWNNGALIVAAHGKGRFVYTGISFFRQLPAGVPGAYRLFANLLAHSRESDAVFTGAALGAASGAATTERSATGRADDQAGVRN